MTLIRRTNPLGELLSLRRPMDRLFENSFVRPRDHLASDDFQLPVSKAALGRVKPRRNPIAPASTQGPEG